MFHFWRYRYLFLVMESTWHPQWMKFSAGSQGSATPILYAFTFLYYWFLLHVRIFLPIRSICVYVCSYIYNCYFIIHYFALYEECRLCSSTHSSEPNHELKFEVYLPFMKMMISGVRSHLASGLFNCEIDKFVDWTSILKCVTVVNEWESQTFPEVQDRQDTSLNMLNSSCILGKYFSPWG